MKKLPKIISAVFVFSVLVCAAFTMQAQTAGAKPSKTPIPKAASTPLPDMSVKSRKVSDIPLPCILTIEDLPKIFGVKLDMPIVEARRVYPKVAPKKVDFGPGQTPPPNFVSVNVPARSLPKNVVGFPVESLEFTAAEEPKVESMALKLTNTQTLGPVELFEKMSVLLNMSPEVWLLVDHGNGAHMSWRSFCRGFHVQFDAQKGFYYRLWISKTYEVPKAPAMPVGDGE